MYAVSAKKEGRRRRKSREEMTHVCHCGDLVPEGGVGMGITMMGVDYRDMSLAGATVVLV